MSERFIFEAHKMNIFEGRKEDEMNIENNITKIDNNVTNTCYINIQVL